MLFNTIFAIAVCAASAVAADTTPVVARALTSETGCSCNGWPNDKPIFKAYGAGSNFAGWCFRDGELTTDGVAKLEVALANSSDDEHVNGIEGLKVCKAANKEFDCANYLVSQYKANQPNTFAKRCRYPPRVMPIGCNRCAYHCQFGDRICGKKCIPTIDKCNV